MAVGDNVFDGQKPPPILYTALNYEKWGIGDIMQLPAGLLPRMNTVLSYYHAVRGYTSAAGNTSGWAKSNPQAWDLVAYIIEQRMERSQRGNS